MADNIFAKIIAKQIPAKIVYEDDRALAFRDIGPKAPVHVLIVPKKDIARVSEAAAADEPLLGHLLTVAAEVARREGVDESGYRLVINKGPDAGESVPHLHVHLLGGRPLAWPPG
jgi:histidine triad (HIT) family protein